MTKPKRLLIIGPAFRRRKGDSLPAFERFDGLFYRVARKYLTKIKDVDVIVMKDDLTLVNGSDLLPYTEPEGSDWSAKSLSKNVVESAKKVNENFLKNKLGRRKYSEVFLSMGKVYASALPEIEKCKIKIIFPTSGGPGPKAQALKEWLNRA